MTEVLYAVKFYFILVLLGGVGFAFLTRMKLKNTSLLYLLSKPFGILLVGLPIWLLASFKIVAFNNDTIIRLLFGLLCAITVGIFSTDYIKHAIHGSPLPAYWNLKFLGKIVLFELAFIFLFAVFLYIRSFNSQLEGTERFMDIHLLMSAGKTEYFPFFDGWWPEKDVNYYYYGFYLFALITKLAGVPYSVGYNLAFGTLFVLTILGTITIAYRFTKSLVFSALAAYTVTLAGNLHYAKCYISNLGEDIAAKCYYPIATRIINPAHTINEFPSYSFALGDMHPHVMSIPFFLMNLYFIIEFYKQKKLNTWLLGALFIGMASVALINTWDFMTLGVIFAFSFLPKLFKKYKSNKTKNILLKVRTTLLNSKVLILSGILIALSPFILFLPFFLHFKSPVQGIGFAPTVVLERGSDLPPQCIDEKQPGIDTCNFFERYIVGPLNNYQYPSSIWFLFGIYGLSITLIIASLIFLKFKKEDAKLYMPKALFYTSILLIIFTEVFYFKDLFHMANPVYFRANTVFKFGYHAWILLGISMWAFLHSVWKSLSLIKSRWIGITSDFAYCIVALAFLVTTSLFTYQATKQVYNPELPCKLSREDFVSCGVTDGKTITLDGTLYMKAKAPDDYKVVQWLNENQKQRVVLLEAVGGSYSYYGRIGVNTGMGNPVNWETHEWTWRFSYPSGFTDWRDGIGKNINTGFDEITVRTTEAKKIYQSSDQKEIESLIAKYNITYVYVGELERTTYLQIPEDVFQSIGTVVFQSGNSKLYRVNGK